MDRVKVGVRIRPLIGLEINNGCANAIQLKTNPTDGAINSVTQTVTINIPSRKNSFDFDWVFGPNSSQSTVYHHVSFLQHPEK